MSSDAQADAPTRTLEGPRPVGASDTPLSSQQKQERISSTIEQSEEKVLHALRTFLVDKSLESSGLRLGDNVIDGEQLWMPVMRAGGYDTVTSGKLWAAIGRSFGFPKGMTDLSHRVKKAFETQLLPFERAVKKGEMPDVTSADLEAATQKELVTVGGDNNPRKAVKRERGPGEIAGRSAAKRGRGGGPGRSGGRGGRGGGRLGGGGTGLVGARVLIKFDEETKEDGSVFYIGTVTSFSKEKHLVKFDDGDLDDINLSEEVWRLATADDEAEASQAGGRVAMKEADLAIPDKPSGVQGSPLAKANKALNVQQARDKPSQPSGDDALELKDKMQDEQTKSDEDSEIMVQGKDYKVRQGLLEGQPCYEIYVMVGPMNKEDVKVKCWHEGRVRVHGTPHPGIEKWTKEPIEHDIQLPSRIDPYSAKALITLHGLLYISVSLGPTTSPGTSALRT